MLSLYESIVLAKLVSDYVVCMRQRWIRSRVKPRGFTKASA